MQLLAKSTFEGGDFHSSYHTLRSLLAPCVCKSHRTSHGARVARAVELSSGDFEQLSMTSLPLSLTKVDAMSTASKLTAREVGRSTQSTLACQRHVSVPNMTHRSLNTGHGRRQKHSSPGALRTSTCKSSVLA